MAPRVEPVGFPRGSRFCIPHNSNHQLERIRAIVQQIEDGLAVAPLWYYSAAERRFVRMRRGAVFSRFEVKARNADNPCVSAKGAALQYVLVFALLGREGEVRNDEVERTRDYLNWLLASDEELNVVYRGGVRQIRVLDYNATVDGHFLCDRRRLDMGKDWVLPGYAPALEWKALELFPATYASLKETETPEWAEAKAAMTPAELRSVDNAMPKVTTTLCVRKEGWCVGERGPFPRPQAEAERRALLAADHEAKAQAEMEQRYAVTAKPLPEPTWAGWEKARNYWGPTKEAVAAEKAQYKARVLARLKATPRPTAEPTRPTPAEAQASERVQARRAKSAERAQRADQSRQKEAALKEMQEEAHRARARWKWLEKRETEAERNLAVARAKRAETKIKAALPGAARSAKEAAATAKQEVKKKTKELARACAETEDAKAHASECALMEAEWKSLPAPRVLQERKKRLDAKVAQAARADAAAANSAATTTTTTANATNQAGHRKRKRVHTATAKTAAMPVPADDSDFAE